ncbi:MAG: hypothetical protein CMP11_06655 [Zetaproteobacteria bacterium]|nr:hypothetical protein [Pseudobdellovibrionaceae bacterium]
MFVSVYKKNFIPISSLLFLDIKSLKGNLSKFFFYKILLDWVFFILLRFFIDKKIYETGN